MPRIAPIHWKRLDCIFKKYGYALHRVEGSHRVYFKEGCTRPIIIPTYDSIGPDIIKGLMRTAKMSREEYFTLLAKC